MPTDLLQELREMALNLKIEPVAGTGSAASVKSIVKVLGEFNKAYENFLAIVLAKDEVYAGIIKDQPAARKTLLQDAELIAVDVNFGSFEVALAPQSSNSMSILFKDDVIKKKEASFEDFKELVAGDFSDQNYSSSIGARFTEDERREIYRPIFSALKPGKYKVDIQDSKRAYVKTLTQPGKDRLAFYVPPIQAPPIMDDLKTYKLYVTMDSESAASGKLTRGSIDALHSVEEVAPDALPIILQRLAYEGLTVEFTRAVVGEIKFEDDLIYVTNERLDLQVWGTTREEAEEAFTFGLYSLYLNFYFEENQNLSRSAVALKGNLANLTKTIILDEG